jgi:uncharacterized membrane protein YfcA
MSWLFSDPAGHPGLLVGIAVFSFALSFIGSAVGLVLGHLRLPLLIAYLGSPPVGAACNLLVSGSGALSGAARHLRAGRVSGHCLVLMGIPSAAGAVLGAYLFSRHISHFWSYVLIGAMLVVSGVHLAWPGKTEAPAGTKLPPTRLLLEVLIGLGLGVLAAVTGLMLGSLRLPMMIRLLKIDPKVAVGSNMAIGFLTALAGAATTLSSRRGAGDWQAMGLALVAVVPPTVVGGYLGGWLTGRLHKDTVRALAGWIIAGTGVLMVVQEVVPLVLKPRVEVPDFTEEDWDPLDPDDA